MNRRQAIKSLVGAALLPLAPIKPEPLVGSFEIERFNRGVLTGRWSGTNKIITQTIPHYDQETTD